MATNRASPGWPISAILRCRPRHRSWLTSTPLDSQLRAELLPALQFAGRPARTELPLRAVRPVRSDKASAGMLHSVARGRQTRTRKAQARSASKKLFDARSFPLVQCEGVAISATIGTIAGLPLELAHRFNVGRPDKLPFDVPRRHETSTAWVRSNTPALPRGSRRSRPYR